MKSFVKIQYDVAARWEHEPQALSLLLYFFMKANFAPVRRGARVIGRGQLICSLQELQDYTGKGRTALNRVLDMLEKAGEIAQEVSRAGRVISLLNYDGYDAIACTTQTQGVHKACNVQTVATDVQSADCTPSAEAVQTQSVQEPCTSQTQAEPSIISNNNINKNNNKNKTLSPARRRMGMWLFNLRNEEPEIFEKMASEMHCEVEAVYAEARSIMDEWGVCNKCHRDESDFRSHLLSTLRIRLKTGARRVAKPSPEPVPSSAKSRSTQQQLESEARERQNQADMARIDAMRERYYARIAPNADGTMPMSFVVYNMKGYDRMSDSELADTLARIRNGSLVLPSLLSMQDGCAAR